MRFSTLKIPVMGCRLFGIEGLAVLLLLLGEEPGTSGAKPKPKPVAVQPGAMVSPLSQKSRENRLFCFCKESQTMARNPHCSPCLETLGHKTQTPLGCMRFFSKTNTILSPFARYVLRKFLFLVYGPFGESVWEGLPPTIFDLSRFLFDL